MSNLDKNIQDRLKEKFEQQEFELENAWLDDMSSKLDEYNKEDKGRKKFFIWFFAGLMLLGSAGLLWHNTNSSKDISKNSTQNETRNALQTDDFNAKNRNANNALLEEDCETKGALADFQSRKESKLLAEQTTKSSSKATVSKRVSNHTKATQNNQNHLIARGKEQASSKHSSQRLISTNTPKEKPNTFAEKQNKENSSSVASKINKPVKSEQNSITPEQQKRNKNTVVKAEKKKISSTEKLVEKQEKTISKTDSLLAKAEEIVKKDSLKIPEETLATNNSEKDKSKRKNKDLGLSLSISAGPSILFRQFKTDTQNPKRKTEEKNKIAWNVNLDLQKTFKNNLIIGSGLHLTNYGEKINYSPVLEPHRVVIKETETHNYFNLKISKMGSSYTYDTTAIVYTDTIVTYKDSTYTNTTVKEANGITNFTFVEIPIVFGYRIVNTPKFSLSAITGISTGFLVHSKGQYINTENNLEAAQNKQILVNYLFSAQLNYKVYKNLSLNLSPHFKYNLNNQSRYSNTQKRYGAFGINAGLSVAF